MSCRLARWRASQALSAEVIGALAGLTADELRAIEDGAQCSDADRFALELLFGDVFTLSDILTCTIAADEREIMRRFSFQFAEQCRAWTHRGS